MQKLSSNTLSIFESAANEKDIENNYRYYFKTVVSDIVFTSPYGCDGFGVSESKELRVLCEFKDDLNLKQRNDLVKVLCQSIYYIKKFEQAGQKLPKTIFIGDRNECVVMHVNEVFQYLSMNFDWSIAPSNAHKNLELYQALYKDEKISPFIFEIDALPYAIEKCIELNQNVKRLIPITPHNITEVFNYFEKNVVGSHTLSTNELTNLFIQILISPSENYPHPVKIKKVIVTKNYGEVQVKSKESFDSFFGHFSREYTPREKEVLTSIVDRLVEDTTRRKQGEFFTPTIWVDKAHEYIASVFGEDWKEKYVVWDPAWGTGNLTRDYKFKELYVSTLNQSDIDTANQMGYNLEATKFQFDFLNDPDEKLPQGLRDAIESGREIIVLMNPPYGEPKGDSKEGKIEVNSSETSISYQMNKFGLGYATRQLYTQFLYKLSEISTNKVHIATFSNGLYKTAVNFKPFRNYFFKKYKFEKGFLFEASHFADVSTAWGVDFSIWENEKKHINNFNMDLIGMDKNFNLNLIKTIEQYNTDDTISSSDWIRNLLGKVKLEKTLQLKTALEVGFSNTNNIAPNSLGYLRINTNKVKSNAQEVGLYSTATSNRGGVSLLYKNFREGVCLFSARKLILSNWVNVLDEYLKPNTEHTEYIKFSYDSIVYSLFNSHSQQSSLRQVAQKDQLWNIKNEFFWIPKEEMLNIANENNYSDLYNDARTDSDRHVYKLLFGEERIYDRLSPDAKLVLDKATELVRKSMSMREIFANEQNHLKSWDAGYAQLKLLWKEYYADDFKEFRELYKNLEDRMRPLVYELGFLMK